MATRIDNYTRFRITNTYMRLTSLLLLSWSITAGWLTAQTSSASLPLLYNAETKGVTGFAVKVGERIIGVADATYLTERNFDWTLRGQKQGWKFDSAKMLRPMNLGYYPLVENGPSPPVVAYNSVFSLANGEPLILHDGNGATLQGNFMIQHYKTGSYSSDQGFRPLEVSLPNLPKSKNEPSFKVVTKSDGRQVVGMVLGTSSNGVIFEPLLVGHPVFRGMPPSNVNKVFGRTVSPAAANALARWICPDFFPMELGVNVKPWQVAWRVAPGITTFVIKGGDMRLCFDTMTVSTMGMNAADTKKDRMYRANFSTPKGTGNPNGYDGLGLVNALIDALGDPTEASYFEYKPDNRVALRFSVSSTTDFLVSIGSHGPRSATLGRLGDSVRTFDGRAYAKETKLSTTRKDVLDALAMLKRG